MTTYLQDLTLRLAGGLARVDPDVRSRHAGFLKRAQREDGGFGGRMGDSDLYYTSFALRGLAILDELDDVTAESAASFVARQAHTRQSIVDFFSLIYSAALLQALHGIDVFHGADPAWGEKVAVFLRSLQREDGGFAKAAEGEAGSTYHTFLVLLVMQLIGESAGEPGRIADFLISQRLPDGGFREIRAAKRSGTNPTAAAIAALRILDRLDAETIDQAMDFLVDMQTDEGGFRANTRIPVADLLSTFTGLLTVDDLGEIHELELDAIAAFTTALQSPEGGFRAAAWDEACDVEYTFYGLGALALLENHRQGNG
jgi:geranylgeranyl transferase type-2 subunit beta